MRVYICATTKQPFRKHMASKRSVYLMRAQACQHACVNCVRYCQVHAGSVQAAPQELQYTCSRWHGSTKVYPRRSQRPWSRATASTTANSCFPSCGGRCAQPRGPRAGCWGCRRSPRKYHCRDDAGRAAGGVPGQSTGHRDPQPP